MPCSNFPWNREYCNTMVLCHMFWITIFTREGGREGGLLFSRAVAHLLQCLLPTCESEAQTYSSLLQIFLGCWVERVAVAGKRKCSAGLGQSHKLNRTCWNWALLNWYLQNNSLVIYSGDSEGQQRSISRQITWFLTTWLTSIQVIGQPPRTMEHRTGLWTQVKRNPE